jgi:putative endopeptidase
VRGARSSSQSPPLLPTSSRRALPAHLADSASAHSLDLLESDPFFPPAPQGYDRRDEPRRTLAGPTRVCAVLTAVGLSCLAVAALIDVVAPPSGGVPTGRSERQVADAVLGAMDRSADPCASFYEYACGSWMRSARIPKDRSIYQKAFSSAGDSITLQVRELLENEMQRPDAPPAQAKAGLFYASCLDQAAIGGLRPAPLYGFKSVLSSISTPAQFATALGTLHANLYAGMFDVDVGIDQKNPVSYVLYLSQAGLGMPSKESYTSSSESAVKLRGVYRSEIEAMLGAGGRARIIPRFGHASLAARVLDFETLLADAHLMPSALRDPNAMYNPRTLAELPKDLHIYDYLTAAGIDENTLVNSSVILASPQYFEKIASLMARVSGDVEWQRTVRAYLVFHLVRRMAALGALGENLHHAHFAFVKQLYGVQKLEERWKMCQKRTAKFMGDAIGAAYVDKHFSPARRQVASRMTDSIVTAFDESLDKQDWMTPETLASAKRKLAAISVKIGHTDKPDLYEDVVAVRSSFAGNIVSASTHAWRRAIDRLGGPIDKSQMLMSAQEVNAYYQTTRNEIAIPAGILVQPFFSDAFPSAMNYGSIGSIVGHELSHGFDDVCSFHENTFR